ncbi:MAG: DUF434 domain-containing protein [Vulcanimicrobiota bacterium]
MRHRGPHPEDEELFAPSTWPELQAATAELSWLLSRGYARKSALKLVGDHHQLRERQRIAVSRCTCSEQERAARLSRQCTRLASRLWIDGFNLLTTLEAALAGGFILAAQDGCYRDMASLHGTYRRVDETAQAVVLVGEFTGPTEAHWLFDQPVSNSGRLAALVRELADQRGWPWTVELVPDPDPLLADCAAMIASADSAILDRAAAWFNLARAIVDARIPTARIVPLDMA